MPTTLSTDEMKDLVRAHFEDFVNNRRPEVIHQNMTGDFFDHDGPGGEPADASADEQMMTGMLQALPGLTVTLEDMIAEGDKVVCRNIWRFTDHATGTPQSFQGFVLWRFDGDKIAERWATVSPPTQKSSWVPG